MMQSDYRSLRLALRRLDWQYQDGLEGARPYTTGRRRRHPRARRVARGPDAGGPADLGCVGLLQRAVVSSWVVRCPIGRGDTLRRTERVERLAS